MRISELPEKLKFYRIEMSTHHYWIVDGETKEKIMCAKSHFIRMEDGQYLNKSFITEIVLDPALTKENFLLLSPEQQVKISPQAPKKLSV